MPLSEHEQRMLEQMERALYAEDPKFASALEGHGLRGFTWRRVYQAAAGFLAGVALLMGGVVAQMTWVMVLGFVIMLGCAALGVIGWRRSVRPAARQRSTAPSGGHPHTHGIGFHLGRSHRQPHVPRGRGSLMDRIEARWQRRRDDQYGA